MKPKLKHYSLIKKLLKNIPESCGVYVFSDFKQKPIYVGKAINLKNRVSSYFSKAVFGKTKEMVASAKNISYIKVNSEIEALLLEAKLVKLYKPKYNFALKDDKNPLYIVITSDKYPQVLTARKINLADFKFVFGPFPSSGNVRFILRMLRKIFPYATHKVQSKPCLYSQIGLCEPCPSEIEKITDNLFKKIKIKEYRENISNIKKFLKGNFPAIKNGLAKKMQDYINNEGFENAQVLKSKIEIINYITSTFTPVKDFLINPNLSDDLVKQELADLTKLLNNFFEIKDLKKIECYDVSHLSGIGTTASMITFINGSADKNFYRRFKIRKTKESNDLASLSEVAQRRSKHFFDWGKPDLIIVDGGEGQVKVFKQIMDEFNVPVIGLAKRHETLIIPTNGTFFSHTLANQPAKRLVQKLRDEAHRFAKKYHHLLLKKYLLEV